MPDTAKFTILVVDDAEENIDVLLELLGDDYDVSVAMDGETALEDISETRPDLILLDIMMPGMDGFEVCRRLKADPETSSIPIIFITGKTETEDMVKGYDLGAADYVTKPFNPPELMARLKAHLRIIEQQRIIDEAQAIIKKLKG
ncbi:MAG: response regulator [Chitinivibrionales bacterium]|nr:response regulator [Chitinivibrionales bacterium]